MRTLTDHKTNETNDSLTILVTDEPGQGGACHAYSILSPRDVSAAPPDFKPLHLVQCQCAIRFQNGPIKETGVNGVTHEALLAIVIDRLRSFQDGPFASHYNDIAMMYAENALMWLQKRTRDRLARGVEGMNVK